MLPLVVVPPPLPGREYRRVRPPEVLPQRVELAQEGGHHLVPGVVQKRGRLCLGFLPILLLLWSEAEEAVGMRGRPPTGLSGRRGRGGRRRGRWRKLKSASRKILLPNIKIDCSIFGRGTITNLPG